MWTYEQFGRKLIKIESEEEWNKLPKDVRAQPVYYRITDTGIDLWPMWHNYCDNWDNFHPEIRVSP